MEKIESFYKEYEDMFEEYLENSRRYLRNNNEKYAELQNEYNKILEQNENLTWVLEGDIKDRNLSNEECFSLSKLVQIYYDMQSIEEQEIFFLGGKEAYFFFKKIGVLKWVLCRFLECASNVFVLTPQIPTRMGQVPNPNKKKQKVRWKFIRNRNIKINIFLNEEENKIFNEKVKKSGLNKSEFFRKIILDYQLKEKPDEKFYEVLSQLRGMATNLNQIARACNRYGYVNNDKYIPLAHKIEDLVLSLQEVYVVSKRQVDA